MAGEQYGGPGANGAYASAEVGRFYDASTPIFQKMMGAEDVGGIHAGIWDNPSARRWLGVLRPSNYFRAIRRQNEVPAEWANVQPEETVLDAGSGVGGTSVDTAHLGAQVLGVTLSPIQAQLATEREARRRALEAEGTIAGSASFAIMDFTNTGLPDMSVDVVIANETFCYAEDKGKLSEELYRVLRPGGRVISLDGFLTDPKHNNHWVMRRHLKGWLLPPLSTMDEFAESLITAGFESTETRDITELVKPTIRILGLMYLGGSAVMAARRVLGKRDEQVDSAIRANLVALRGQWLAHKLNLGLYGVVMARKAKEGTDARALEELIARVDDSLALRP